MIDKTLTIAQTLGDHLAEGKLPSWSKLMGHDTYQYFQLKPLKDIDQAIALWQGLLRNFVNIPAPIDLIVSGNKSKIILIIGLPSKLTQYFENIYFANFPSSDLERIQYSTPTSHTYVNFGDDEIATDIDFIKNGQYMDPFKDVLSLYDVVPNDECMDIIYRCVFKKSDSLSTKLRNKAKSLVWGHATSTTQASVSAFDGKEVTQQVEFTISFAHSNRQQTGIASMITSVFSKYSKTGKVKTKSTPLYKKILLNQFVNFYHFLDKEFAIPNLEYTTFRKLPAPTSIPSFDNTVDKNDLTILGYTDYKSNSKIFGIRREDKLRHMYIIGQTGTGKSKFIANMVRSDMISNKGVCVIDPHGDLIDDILSQVPSYRTNDVVLFDVSDRDFPVGFNVFEFDKPEEKPLIASGIIGIFKKMFGNSWGPRLEYILRNVVLSLLEYPNATFLDLVRMLTDNDYKEEVLEYVKDPIILRFWRDEFDKQQPKQREEAIAPITNKVGQFTSSTIVRNIFGQSKTKLKFRQMMDDGKIILVNLSKGKIGDDNMAMIGSFIASKIQIDAMSRADIDESERKDFYLYIDEFQNFATESFASILSEARKYRLALIMANQYISQLDPTIRDAIFGNVGTIIANRIGKDDAQIMSQQFKELAKTNDFLSLPNRRCYIKLMINGMVSDPFSMKTADFVKYEDFELVKSKVREQSRQRYAMPRNELEILMKTWAEKKFSASEKAIEKAKAQAKAAKEKLKQDKEKEQGQTQTDSNKLKKTENNIIIARDEAVQSIESNPERSEKDQIVNNDFGVGTQFLESDLGSEVIEGEVKNAISSSEGQSSDDDFLVDDIVIGQEYDGFVKLKYNYGLFVTVYGVEGLLHKNFIQAPEGVSWKKLYEIGDPIKVTAMEFKEIEGEKRVVWKQI